MVAASRIPDPRTVVKSRYCLPGQLRDVYVVQAPAGHTSLGYQLAESWLIAIWHVPEYRTWCVQAKMRWCETGGGRRAYDVPALVLLEAESCPSLAAARKRARQLMLVLGRAMEVEMVDHRGRLVRVTPSG